MGLFLRGWDHMNCHRNDEHNGKVVQPIPEEWARLIKFCQQLGHGELEKLNIQDGVPMIADIVREKVKFT